MQDNSYQNLYLTILQIGQQNLFGGTSLNQLKNDLAKLGFPVKENDCVEMAIDYWFFTSFHHLKPDGKQLENIEDLKDHQTCNFILKGEASLLLLEHQNINRSVKFGRNAVIVGVAAIIIACIGVFLTYKGVYKSNEVDETQKNKALPVIEQQIIRQKN